MEPAIPESHKLPFVTKINNISITIIIIIIKINEFKIFAKPKKKRKLPTVLSLFWTTHSLTDSSFDLCSAILENRFSMRLFQRRWKKKKTKTEWEMRSEEAVWFLKESSYKRGNCIEFLITILKKKRKTNTCSKPQKAVGGGGMLFPVCTAGRVYQMLVLPITWCVVALDFLTRALYACHVWTVLTGMFAIWLMNWFWFGPKPDRVHAIDCRTFHFNIVLLIDIKDLL